MKSHSYLQSPLSNRGTGQNTNHLVLSSQALKMQSQKSSLWVKVVWALLETTDTSLRVTFCVLIWLIYSQSLTSMQTLNGKFTKHLYFLYASESNNLTQLLYLGEVAILK